MISRSHAPRGNAKLAALRPEGKGRPIASSGPGRRAAKRAFPRGAWERGGFTLQFGTDTEHTATPTLPHSALPRFSLTSIMHPFSTDNVSPTIRRVEL